MTADLTKKYGNDKIIDYLKNNYDLVVDWVGRLASIPQVIYDVAK